MTRPLVAVSLKMYFDRTRSLEYLDAVRDLAGRPAVAAGDVRLAVLPDFLTVPAACETLSSTAALVGAQNLGPADRGAFTGEVSGADLAALGCSCVEIGHAERRTIFGEDDALVAAKTAAAVRNGLVPLLCVGEADRSTPEAAARDCVRQVERALAEVTVRTEVWIAYEPYWAIGATEPAPADHVRAVCDGIRAGLGDAAGETTLIYGGSAGPGLLTELGDAVDGLFLGRFAHDPSALAQVVDEAATRAGTHRA
ncbi:triose-phosphate isomerase family protein [Georgenia daeguensis]|uniref:Triosephosphate isomerase n=1 Tax=Georgenia daeguensis TaxID=908355 RepID=A0ABP8EW39_9MICO